MYVRINRLHRPETDDDGSRSGERAGTTLQGRAPGQKSRAFSSPLPGWRRPILCCYNTGPQELGVLNNRTLNVGMAQCLVGSLFFYIFHSYCLISIRNPSHYFLSGEGRSNSANYHHHYRVGTYFSYRVCGKLSKRRGGRRRGRCVYYFVSIIITYGGFFSVSFFSFFSFPLPALFPPWSGCSGRLFFFSVGLLPQHILGGKQGSIQQGRVVVLLELQRFNILFQFSHGSCFREAQK